MKLVVKNDFNFLRWAFFNQKRGQFPINTKKITPGTSN